MPNFKVWGANQSREWKSSIPLLVSKSRKSRHWICSLQWFNFFLVVLYTQVFPGFVTFSGTTLGLALLRYAFPGGCGCRWRLAWVSWIGGGDDELDSWLTGWHRPGSNYRLLWGEGGYTKSSVLLALFSLKKREEQPTNPQNPFAVLIKYTMNWYHILLGEQGRASGRKAHCQVLWQVFGPPSPMAFQAAHYDPAGLGLTLWMGNQILGCGAFQLRNQEAPAPSPGMTQGWDSMQNDLAGPRLHLYPVSPVAMIGKN